MKLTCRTCAIDYRDNRFTRCPYCGEVLRIDSNMNDELLGAVVVVVAIVAVFTLYVYFLTRLGG